MTKDSHFLTTLLATPLLTLSLLTTPLLTTTTPTYATSLKSSSFGIDTFSYPEASQERIFKEDSQSTEINHLKQLLQATSRKLKEYQSQLFRASHPKDLIKIAELGQLLAEKEKRNHELTVSLEELEQELARTRKQVQQLENTSETLHALLNTYRNTAEKDINNFKENVAQLTTSHKTDKEELIAKLEAYEERQQLLLKDLEHKQASIHELNSAILAHRDTKEKFAQEKQELLEQLSQAVTQHHSRFSQLAVHYLEEWQTAEILSHLSQKTISEYQDRLHGLIDGKQEALNVVSTALSDEAAKTSTLEKQMSCQASHLSSAIDYANGLEYALENVIADNQQTQAALRTVENNITELAKKQHELAEENLKLQHHNAELANQLSVYEQQQQHQLATDEHEESLAALHSHYQASLEEAVAKLDLLQSKFQKEKNLRILLQDQLTEALAKAPPQSEPQEAQNIPQPLYTHPVLSSPHHALLGGELNHIKRDE